MISHAGDPEHDLGGSASAAPKLRTGFLGLGGNWLKYLRNGRIGRSLCQPDAEHILTISGRNRAGRTHESKNSKKGAYCHEVPITPFQEAHGCDGRCPRFDAAAVGLRLAKRL